MSLAKRATHLESVDVGEVDVQHDGGRPFARKLERLLASGRFHRAQRATREHTSDAGPETGVAVDDQNVPPTIRHAASPPIPDVVVVLRDE